MKKHYFCKFIISVICLTMSLFSCQKNGNENSSVEPDTPLQPKSQLLEKPDWSLEDDNLIEYDKEGYYDSNVFIDVEPNFTFKLAQNDKSKEMYDPTSELKVYDSQHIIKSLNYTYSDYIYSFSPIEPYEKGRYYTIEINDNSTLIFKDKNPSLREVHFNVKAEEKKIFDVRDDVKKFLLDDIISQADNPLDNTYSLTIKKPLNLKQGDTFLFYNGKEMDDDSFFGEFIKEEKVSNTYLLTYTVPDLNKVFKEDGVDVLIRDYQQGEIEDLQLNSKKNIENQVKNSKALTNFFYQNYLQVVKDDQLILRKKDFLDFVDMASINIDFGLKWPGWSFELNISFTVPMENKISDYTDLTWNFNYYRLSNNSISSSFKLRKKLGIPYWADMSFDLKEDVSNSFTVTVAFGPKFKEDDDDKRKKYQSLKDYVKSEVSNLKQADSKFKTYDKLSSDNVNLSGNKLSIAIGKGRWPFYVFDLYISFSIDVTLDLKGVFNYNYTSRSINHIIEYKNSEDDVKGGTSKEYSSSSHDIAIGAKLSFSLGINFTIGLGVVGLEKYIHLQGTAFVGVYFKAQIFGVVMIQNFNEEQSKSTINYSGFIEAGFLFTLKVDLKFFFLGVSFTPLLIKVPFFSVSNDVQIMSYVKEEEITIHEKEFDINTTELLSFYVFDPYFMRNREETYDADKEVNIYRDKKNVTERMFNFTFKEGKYLYYRDGKIHIKDNAPIDFYDTMYIDNPEEIYRLSDGEKHLKEVPIHYISSLARPIYIDDVFIGYQYWGEKFKLPKAQEKKGYKFYGYQYERTSYYYDENEEIIIQKGEDILQPVHFYTSYYEYVTFTVNFYDGKENLISSQQVERGKSAVEPSASLRDKNMSGYTFICWSTDFSKVFYDLDIYGIYGGIENV